MKYAFIIVFGILSSNVQSTHAKDSSHSDLPVQSTSAGALNTASEVIYLGNEGLLIKHGKSKVLFDPFFHNSFGVYHLVPEAIRNAIFTGEAPYDDIDAIFISHAHADHFAAEDVARFLTQHPAVSLIAPKQAIIELKIDTSTKTNIIALDLAYQDAPMKGAIEGVKFDAVRIPHAGWPQRAEVSNIVYRVQLDGKLTVIHMGDADPDDDHFKPLMAHWEQTAVDAAFPPYWFFTSRNGPMILANRIQAKRNIGVHVPIKVPFDLYKSGQQYFTDPGETLVLP